jgi:hypothetical protein
MLPADVISTGVDSGVTPPAMLEQMAWDACLDGDGRGCDVHSHGCRDY